jgi:hypothetical protein
MITLNIDTIRYQAQTALVNLGVDNSLAYLEGKVNEDVVEKGLSLIDLLFSLEYKDYLTEEEQENILYCLVEISEINSFPAAPILSPVAKPNILVGIQGEKGEEGIQGPSGEANVNVISDPAFDNITSSYELIGNIRTWKLGYDPYVASFAGMVINGDVVLEVGASENISFTASIAVGREAIVSQTITSPITPSWITDPQTFSDGGVIVTSKGTRVYTARVDDGTTVDTDSKVIDFVYPIFYGSSANILTGAQIYSQLNKLTEKIGNKNIPFAFTDEYAYFAFDSAYDDSNIQILNGSGLNVTAEFTKVDYNQTAPTEPSQVDSGASLATNWQKNYIVYRTTVKTDISETYQFLNVTE